MKLGLFRESFDPIHKEHFNIANNAYNQFNLDSIVFIPSKRAQFLDSKSRYDLIKKATRDIPYFDLKIMNFI